MLKPWRIFVAVSLACAAVMLGLSWVMHRTGE